MNTHTDKTQESKSQSVANEVTEKQSSGESAFQFVDNRPEAVAQRKLQEVANNSPQDKQAQLKSMAYNHSVQQQQPIQKKEVRISSGVNVVQRVVLSATEFQRALFEHIFGTAASFPGLAAFNKNLFVTDLIAEAGGNYDLSEIRRLGIATWRFVKELDAALTYRAANVSIVNNNRRNNPRFNFGDDPGTGRLIGGTGNAWPSIHVNDLPARIRNIQRYLPALNPSVSMGGNGYDYRTGSGSLFHIRK